MEGKLVRLRAWEKTASDVDALMRWFNDEGILRRDYQRMPRS